MAWGFVQVVSQITRNSNKNNFCFYVIEPSGCFFGTFLLLSFQRDGTPRNQGTRCLRTWKPPTRGRPCTRATSSAWWRTPGGQLFGTRLFFGTNIWKSGRKKVVHLRGVGHIPMFSKILILILIMLFLEKKHPKSDFFFYDCLIISIVVLASEMFCWKGGYGSPWNQESLRAKVHELRLPGCPVTNCASDL